jgi:hypothetical protein
MFAASKTGAPASPPVYVEDVFSTYLYTGTGSAQTITNGIDLSTKGGLVWVKGRTSAWEHKLTDTVRGATNALISNTSDAQTTDSNGLTSFSTTGFVLGSDTNYNWSGGGNWVSWTLRKQSKFFDVVTYTGNGSARTIAHNLGSVPGCIIVKNLSSGIADWQVYHRSLSNTQHVRLNTSAAVSSTGDRWNSTTPTSTVFSIGTDTVVNGSGDQFVAYLFAHDAGGFGLTGTDNVISCGSFTTDGSSNATVSLGYEPQWVLIKRTDGAQNWILNDVMRGMGVGSTSSNTLFPNSSGAEYTAWSASPILPNATGFVANGSGSGGLTSSATYIYIAIRRGPMKTPTSGTSVFNLASATEPDTTPLFSPGTPPPDSVWYKPRLPQAQEFYLADRLRGNNVILASNAQDAERSATASIVPPWKFNSGQKAQLDAGVYFNNSGGAGVSYALYALIRAPGFFDEVCYSGNSVNGRTITHNLGVAPQLMIVKARTSAINWSVYAEPVGNTFFSNLNDITRFIDVINCWNNTSPTSSVFTVSDNSRVNRTGDTYVAYLFATCPGVSKVGSYTGTGALQTVNCGFASGARFVLIKRIDVNENWYVWDSARGISSGNDPYLLLNTATAEVTGTNYVDTDTTGFKVTAAAPSALNASGSTYLFLAIA